MAAGPEASAGNMSMRAGCASPAGVDFSAASLPRADRTAMISVPRQDTDLGRVLVIIGATSAGKDHLTKGLTTLNRPPSFGTLLAQHMGVESRDQLRHVPAEDLEPHYPAVVSAIQKEAPAVVTAHPVFQCGGNWVSAPDIYHMLKPKVVVTVTADVKDIVNWREQRNRCGQRASALCAPEVVEEEQYRTLAVMGELAEQVGCGSAVVYNNPRKTDHSMTFLGKLVERYFADPEPYAPGKSRPRRVKGHRAPLADALQVLGGFDLGGVSAQVVYARSTPPQVYGRQ